MRKKAIVFGVVWAIGFASWQMHQNQEQWFSLPYNPVSYTHLDVYKRQRSWYGRRLPAHGSGGAGRGSCQYHFYAPPALRH